MIKQKNLWSPFYGTLITDNKVEDLELGVCSMKLDIWRYPPKVKKLFKVLTVKKTKQTHIPKNGIKKLQIDGMRNQPQNTSVKQTGMRKALSTIVGLLEKLQPDIWQRLMETNVVLPVLHPRQIYLLFRKKTSCLMKATRIAWTRKISVEDINSFSTPSDT